MDISVKNWEPGKSYKKDDIVKLGNIAAYGEFPLRIRVDPHHCIQPLPKEEKEEGHSKG